MGDSNVNSTRPLFCVPTLHRTVQRLFRPLMITIVQHSRRRLLVLGHQIAAGPKLAFVFIFLALTIAGLITVYDRHRNQVDEARSGQLILNEIAVHTRSINNITWTALQQQELTPEADNKIRTARKELTAAVLAAHIRTYHTAASEEVWQDLDAYIRFASRRVILLETGDLEQAQHDDLQHFGPQFDLLQQKIQVAIDTEGKWAESRALTARNELLVAGLLACSATFMAFSGLQKQQYLNELAVTERNALRESEERFRALTEQATDIILITDESGTIKYASPSVHSVLALHAEELVGTNFVARLHPDDAAKVVGVGSGPTQYGHTSMVEFRLQHENMDWLDFECAVRNLTQHKNIGGWVYNARNVTERKHNQEELLFNATHDALTGLPNRTLFLSRLQSVVEHLKRHPQRKAAIIFLDIDDFKVVNDCYGHAIGDLLIKAVSNRLRVCIRSDGTIARMGGDEFTVLVEEVTDPSDAIRVAVRIQSCFAQPFIFEGHEVFKTASIGVALTAPEISADGVLQNADIALYRAKDQGKARMELFDNKMHEEVMNRLRLEDKLRYALQNDELRIHYQPIVAIESGEVQGFEALLRWRAGGSEFVPPGKFIAIAEQCGLIVPISAWVLKTACLEAARWAQVCRSEPPIYVGVNISSRHFSHPDFIKHVQDALARSGVDPHSVTIELTESLAMSEAAATEQTMSQLHELGVKLSIDDFGTGYSSLSYLRRFPVDALKIDQSFVRTMDAENYSIIRTIIGLARSLDLGVIAEGVETTNQLQLLALAGCASAQGYLFAEAMPAKSVDDFITSNRQKCRRPKQRAVASTARS
jgi:diguanylate cyclase (GGDEF)-like protein/PAS domain S-box-containing protein